MLRCVIIELLDATFTIRLRSLAMTHSSDDWAEMSFDISFASPNNLLIIEYE